MSLVEEDVAEEQADIHIIEDDGSEDDSLIAKLKHIDEIEAIQNSVELELIHDPEDLDEEDGEGLILEEHEDEACLEDEEVEAISMDYEQCTAEVAEDVMVEEHMAEEHEVVEISEEKPKPVNLPPLRPLTIAPKPAKLPMSFKPVAGQQLFIVQGAGAGQQIKLLSAGPSLNLSNLSIAKPIAIKQTTNTIVSSKNVVMKKALPKAITTTADTKPQIVVLQKSDPLKLLPSTSQTKTLTLNEAQQMGLIGNTKVISQGKKQLMANKAGPSKAIKIIPQIRAPAKILPAPQIASTSGNVKQQGQRIFLKQANVAPTVIQVPSGHAGQLHQINIPGKGVQYIKFITTSQAAEMNTSAVATSSTPKMLAVLPTKAATTTSKQIIKVVKPSTSTPKASTGGSQVVINRVVLTPSKPIAVKGTPKSPGDAVVPKSASPELTMESNGIKTRKPCNCAKSQCLKLYCDCFANGEFCFQCNCNNCFNNIENEEQRQRAIKNCLERNPNAFRPKIGKGKDAGDEAIRKHTKGCNCKRSGCLKNYCECYEAKIACSSNCKCMGCMNVDTAPLSIEVANSTDNTDGLGFSTSPPSTKKSDESNNKKRTVAKQVSTYINGAVIEATTNCLVTIAKNAEDAGKSEEATRREIIIEFGRCLKEIIDCSLGKRLL